jgi:hypothetical protein
VPFNFEEFTGRWQATTANVPRAAIQTRGTMSLNKAAFQALGSPRAVTLLYDQGARVIGLRTASPDVRHAYPLRKQPNSDSYVLSAVSFLAHYGIPHDTYTAFEDLSMEGDVLVIPLEKGRQGTAPPRRRAARAEAS